jgi:murein DD-endopeptidase MepM/ murein hydrolase activator NlpD
MASMSNGFDAFLNKLQQAEKAVEKMADKSREFSKNIAASDTAVGKVAQATGMAIQGGKAALGTASQMMGSSLGGGFTNRQITMNPFRGPGGQRQGPLTEKEAYAEKMWKPGTSKTFGEATTGPIKGLAKKLGLADISVEKRTDGRSPGDPFIGPLTREQTEKVARNQKKMEQAKDKLFKNFGIDREQYNGLSEDAQANVRASMYGPIDTIDLMKNMGTMWNTFLPNIPDTVDRAAKYYSAGNYMGNTRSRLSLEQSTLGRFNQIGGLTSKGSDAEVAQYLTGRGMSANRGVYGETINTIANAGRYMNIDNATAAASVEGLTSASGARMLQNFGIYTADLKTGKEKTQAQIFEELAQRLTAGRGGATTEQTMSSIRRGALGVTIDSYFQGDTAGAQMFKQYMIERSQGKTMDFSKGSAYGQSGTNSNPLNAQMALNASDTGAMNQAEDQYIKGLQAAVGPLTLLNEAAGALASTFAGLPNALLSAITGHDTGKGIIKGVSAITNFGSKAISGITEALMSADLTTPWSGALSLTEAGLIGSSAALSFGTAMGATGAMGLIGGMAGHVTASGRGGSGTSKAIVPAYAGIGGSSNDIVQSYGSVTQSLGNPNALYGKRGHGGTDYGMAWGAPIKALADGTVKEVVNNHPDQDQTASHSYGNHVILSHPGGYTTKYAHMSRVADGITVGKPVTRGQVIGYAGNSGYTRGANNQTEKQNGILHSGTHLHLEVWKGSTQIDPETLGPNALVQGSSQGVDPNSSLGLSSAAASSTTAAADTSGTPSYVGDMLSQASALTTPSGNMATGMSLLSQLYSGNADQIMGAMSSISSSLGLSQGQIKAGLGNTSGAYSPINLAGLPSGLFGNAPGSSGYALSGSGAAASLNANNPQTNNNVSIIVQVPDTSQSEALKFAKLVKGYLDNNSLMSNVGRN